MALTCREATRLSLAALGGHAAEAQRLELEAHLGGCLACSQRHGTALALVRQLKEAETETLSPSAREAVRRALMEMPGAPARPAVARQSGWGWWPQVAAGAGALAVAAVVVLLVVGGARPTLQVVAGDVTIERNAGAVANAGATAAGLEAATADAVVLRANRGGRAQLADATVELADGTELWWSAKEQRGHLRRGRITVDIEHRPGQHLEVRTARFKVQVVGTRFTVNPAGVHTERGVVRVVLPTGQVAARLEAGQSWSVAAEPVAAALSPVGVGLGEGGAPGPGGTAQPRPVGVAHAPVARVSAEGTRARADGARAPADGARAPVVGLTGARRLLGRGDSSGARRIVVPLFRQGREIAVEARAIYAESFLIEGRYADAIDGFRLVVRDFAGTAQAESAQFAIAQLESEHGRASDARAALQSYLSRYPRGRFVREAADRLGQLSARER